MTPEARQNEALQTRTTIGFSEVTGIISPQTELLLLRHPLAIVPMKAIVSSGLRHHMLSYQPSAPFSQAYSLRIGLGVADG
jgi:hypothetical protein